MKTGLENELAAVAAVPPEEVISINTLEELETVGHGLE